MENKSERTYAELLQEIAELQKLAEVARAKERPAVLLKLRGQIDTFGLTERELFPLSAPAGKKTYNTKPVAPKYRDPVSQKTWSGRGKSPHWFHPERAAEFAL